MGCYTKKPITDLNFIGAQVANDVLITDTNVGECLLALSPPILFGSPVTSSSIQLGWSTGVGGFEYELFQSLSEFSGFSLIDTLPGNDKLVTGLETSTNYFFRIKYIGNGVESGFSNTLSVTTNQIEAPSDIFFTNFDLNQYRVNWILNSGGNESGVRLERSLNDVDWSIETTLPSASTSHLVVSLNNNTEYFWRVKVLDPVLDSEFSPSVGQLTLPFPVPSGLNLTDIDIDRITANWTSNSGGAEDGFRLQRNLNGIGGGTIIDVGTGIVTYVDDTPSLDHSTQYFYQVKALSSFGDSEYTAFVSAFTLVLSAPSDLVLTPQIDNIQVDWTSNSGGEEDNFEIERSLTEIGGFANVGTVGSGILTFTDTALTQTTEYFYRVRATDSSGESTYSTVVSTTTLTLQPPSALMLSSLFYHTVTASWTSGSSEEDGFELERSLTSGSGFALVESVLAGIVTVEDKGNGLTGLTEYFYRVKAVKASGDSTYSTEQNITTGTSTFDLIDANGDKLVDSNLDQLISDP